MKTKSTAKPKRKAKAGARPARKAGGWPMDMKGKPRSTGPLKSPNPGMSGVHIHVHNHGGKK